MRRKVLLLSFLLLSTFTTWVPFVFGQLSTSPSLFSHDESVVDLRDTTWLSVHHSGPFCPWVVLFYSDACGHCRTMAPKYRTFAKGIDECHEEDPLRMATTAAVNCAQELDACQRHRVERVPALLLFLPPNCTGEATGCADAAMRRVELASSEEGFSRLRVETRRVLKQSLHFSDAMMERCVDMRYALLAAKAQRLPSAGSAPPASFVEDTQLAPTDVAGAFFSTLFHEVPLAGFAPPRRLHALREFLRLVERALPGLEAGALLRALSQLEADPAGLRAARWQRAVLDAHIPFEGKPRAVRWRTCRGSSWQHRGFPCAVWLLLHALTVNADGDGALAVIQNYVRHYFSCEACRRHFVEFNFTATEIPALQLWRAHNAVNARLLHVRDGVDPFVPKRLFPDAHMCPACRTADGEFDPNEILRFLYRRYEWNPDDIARGATGSGPLQSVERAENESNVRRDPIPIHVFFSVFVIVAAVGAGIVRARRKRGYGMHSRTHRYL